VPLLQQIFLRRSVGRSLFSGECLLDDASKDFVYKRSSTNWKGQACS